MRPLPPVPSAGMEEPLKKMGRPEHVPWPDEPLKLPPSGPWPPLRDGRPRWHYVLGAVVGAVAFPGLIFLIGWFLQMFGALVLVFGFLVVFGAVVGLGVVDTWPRRGW
jgi:hypothetical protein